jgi:hypothetical protein
MNCSELSHCWIHCILIPLILWDATWKIIAMWRAARNKHLAWFICIAIFNTVGILPIIYLLTNKKKQEEQ